MNLTGLSVLALSSTLVLSGCTATEVGVSKWAAGGAVAGAAGGALFGHHEKAIYAAAAGGAVAGGLVGYLRNKDSTRYCRYYDEDKFPYDAPCGKP
ncbi:hypothetical protein [Bartonella sp. LJL80]